MSNIRKVAYHEAGHATVFAALGVEVGDVHLDVDNDGWAAGQCHYSFNDQQQLSPRLRALPAAAGDVAEVLAGYESLDDVCDLYLSAWEDDLIAEMLETDWPRIRINLEVSEDPERAILAIVRATDRILRCHWAEVEQRANQLLAPYGPT